LLTRTSWSNNLSSPPSFTKQFKVYYRVLKSPIIETPWAYKICNNLSIQNSQHVWLEWSSAHMYNTICFNCAINVLNHLPYPLDQWFTFTSTYMRHCTKDINKWANPIHHPTISQCIEATSYLTPNNHHFIESSTLNVNPTTPHNLSQFWGEKNNSCIWLACTASTWEYVVYISMQTCMSQVAAAVYDCIQSRKLKLALCKSHSRVLEGGRGFRDTP
jgi:hypothetical protein